MDSHNLKFVNGLADYQQTSKGQTADVSLLITSERLIDNSSISSTTFLLRLQHPNILGWCSWWLCYRKYLVHILFIGKKTYEKGKNRRNYNCISHFKSRFTCQRKKSILKIEFQKLNYRLSIFTIYWSWKSAWDNICPVIQSFVFKTIEFYSEVVTWWVSVHKAEHFWISFESWVTRSWNLAN